MCPLDTAFLSYIRDAAKGQVDGHMLPWAVRDLSDNQIVCSTRYHDIVRAIDRVEIGWTWYAQRCQRSIRVLPCRHSCRISSSSELR